MQPLPRVIRAPGQMWAIRVVAVVAAVLVAVLALAGVAGAAAGLALAWFGWARAATSGIAVRDDGLVVRNPLRTTTIGWSELHEVRLELEPASRLTAYVHRRGGEPIPVFGLRARAESGRVRMQRAITALNTEIARRRRASAAQHA